MNAAVQIRTADAVVVPPPAPEKLTKIEQRIFAELVRAEGQFVTCADLVGRIDGAFTRERIRNMSRYIGNIRLAMRGQAERTIISAGANTDLRYALVTVAVPVDATARRQRTVLSTVAPDGDQTIKGRITQALIAAGGRYLSVTELCRASGCGEDPRSIANVRSRVNEVRSALRTKGIAASILSQGVGEALSYAWSDTVETATAPASAPVEADPNALRPTMRITLPPIGGRSCIYDGDSLVLDGVKQPRVARKS